MNALEYTMAFPFIQIANVIANVILRDPAPLKGLIKAFGVVTLDSLLDVRQYLSEATLLP
jgi:hypothetical protein